MRRALIFALGGALVVVSALLAEVGGDVLGSGCNEPIDAENEVCRAIYPEGVDAWQIVPVFPVGLLAVAAVYRRSLRTLVTAVLVCLLLTVALPLLVDELLL